MTKPSVKDLAKPLSKRMQELIDNYPEGSIPSLIRAWIPMVKELEAKAESQRDTREKVSAARDEMLANVYYTGDERALIVSCFWKVLKILDSHPDSTTGAEGS